MSSIYIHVPFCKQACHYCNFHFSTNFSKKSAVLESIIKEIDLKSNFLNSKKLKSIYFGGGTPSILQVEEIKSILEAIKIKHFYNSDTEITLEANPEDLTESYISSLLEIGINRLSIGTQSFDNKELIFMNRNHNSSQSIECVQKAKQLGFENISLDLIYGIPSNNHQNLHNNLEIISNLNPDHVSAYCLTIEPKTYFGNQLEKGLLPPENDSFVREQFFIVNDFLKNIKLLPYEISNFSKKNKESVHNSNYWNGNDYLGIGPAAHSMLNGVRYFNIESNSKYIEQINLNIIPETKEILSSIDIYNEYILLRLRTNKGIDLDKYKKKFGEQAKEKFILQSKKFVEHKLLSFCRSKKHLRFTNEGKIVSNTIISDLFQ